MKKNEAAFAFARPHSESEEYFFDAQAGMSLRDYFAAKAMQGLVAASVNDGGCVKCDDKFIAPLAYQIADEMIEAREL
jgi:hypothetical protein